MDENDENAAEELFLEFLRRQDSGEDPDFEAFVSENAEHETHLRSLLRDQEAFEQWKSEFNLGPLEQQDSDTVEIRKRDRVWDEAAHRVLTNLRNQSPRQWPYVVRKSLGRGSFGVVREVEEPNLRRRLAMKSVLPVAELSPGSPGRKKFQKRINRFFEEAQILGQLNHPGIVPLHGLGVDPGGRAYFTMRLVKGRDLTDVLARAREGRSGWNRARVLEVLLKVCDAMAYAHSKGVVHRDLKPDNIRVGRYGESYVMDWGLARALGRADSKDLRLRDKWTGFDEERPNESQIHGHLSEMGLATGGGTSIVSTDRNDPDGKDETPLMTMDGDVVGTPAYMSPEQALGKLEAIGPRTDVYALGAILYHLLSGHAPYLHSGSVLSSYDLLELLRDHPPEDLATIAPKTPPELIGICERAMARDANLRTASMDQMAAELRSYLDEGLIQAAPATEPPKWLWPVALGVAALLAFSLGFWLRSQTGSAPAELETSPLMSELAQEADRDMAAQAELWLTLAERALGQGSNDKAQEHLDQALKLISELEPQDSNSDVARRARALNDRIAPKSSAPPSTE